MSTTNNFMTFHKIYFESAGTLHEKRQNAIGIRRNINTMSGWRGFIVPTHPSVP
jgi:hypothetical protein